MLRSVTIIVLKLRNNIKDAKICNNYCVKVKDALDMNQASIIIITYL